MNPDQKITIQDISRRAGVSPSTVSRVLTGNARVSEDKRVAVEEAIRDLNYRPSLLARSLRTNTTLTIGLLINDITNAFYARVVRGVEEVAILNGYNLILCNTNEDPDREIHYLEVLQSKQVDGIIVGPTPENAEFIMHLARQLPIVQVDRYIPHADIGAVVVDNEQGAYEATRYLLEKGHHEIEFVTWQQDIFTLAQRLIGCQRALNEAGFEWNPDHVLEVPKLSSEAAAEFVTEVLSHNPRPRALFALNNQLGLGALGAIRNTGLKIPDDIALVVFDDLLIFTLYTPPISVVRQPGFEIGEHAMRCVLKQINEPDTYQAEIEVLPTQLIVRESA